MQFLIDHCGNLSTDEFSRHTLKKLQEILEERGVNRRDAEQRAERGIAAAPPGRLTINRYINFIKNAFIEGEERGWGVDENLPGKLAKVRPLRIGHTTAKEHGSRDVVEIEDVKRTLPFMRPMIRAMVIIHFRSHMRSQDVCRLRLSDIEMNDPDYPDLWFYAPYEHKTKVRGKDLMKALPPEAQAALKPYAEARKDQPDAFIFSPKDNVKEHRETLRNNRKTSVQPSQKARTQQAKKRKPKFPPKEQYTERSYRQAVKRAIERANKAGEKEMGKAWVTIPDWTPHQLRHRSIAKTRAKFGLKASRDSAGHDDIRTTKGYAKKVIEGYDKSKVRRMAKVLATPVRNRRRGVQGAGTARKIQYGAYQSRGRTDRKGAVSSLHELHRQPEA
jgi:hypothetical protein